MVPPGIDQDDTPGHLRLARYCARNPVSLERLGYHADAGEVSAVTYTSDKAAGPTVGCHTFDPLEFIARLVAHIPDKGLSSTAALLRVFLQP